MWWCSLAKVDHFSKVVDLVNNFPAELVLSEN
jgi:hypothetical protein